MGDQGESVALVLGGARGLGKGDRRPCQPGQRACYQRTQQALGGGDQQRRHQCDRVVSEEYRHSCGKGRFKGRRSLKVTMILGGVTYSKKYYERTMILCRGLRARHCLK